MAPTPARRRKSGESRAERVTTWVLCTRWTLPWHRDTLRHAQVVYRRPGIPPGGIAIHARSATLDVVQRRSERNRLDRTRQEQQAMATNGTAGRTTLADLMAAAAVGAIDPSTEVLTAAAASAERLAERAVAVPAAPASLPATEHECGIAGCRHGNAHPVIGQPDRQVKLACPACGAVARMTSSALAKCGGLRCAGGPSGSHEGTDFAPAARRAYSRRTA